MDGLLYYAAAGLIFFIGLVHSFLGEKYLLIRLFRRNNLPKLFGGTAFTKNTLRFAWHLTTVAWFGFAMLLLYMASGEISEQAIAYIITIVFLTHFLVALVMSKGKHLSWVVFLLITACIFLASDW